jgi:hypothetical protein
MELCIEYPIREQRILKKPINACRHQFKKKSSNWGENTSSTKLTLDSTLDTETKLPGKKMYVGNKRHSVKE